MESNSSSDKQNQSPAQALNNPNNLYSPDLIFNNSNTNEINKPVLSYYHKSISREEMY